MTLITTTTKATKWIAKMTINLMERMETMMDMTLTSHPHILTHTEKKREKGKEREKERDKEREEKKEKKRKIKRER